MNIIELGNSYDHEFVRDALVESASKLGWKAVTSKSDFNLYSLLNIIDTEKFESEGVEKRTIVNIDESPENGANNYFKITVVDYGAVRHLEIDGNLEHSFKYFKTFYELLGNNEEE